MRAAETEASIGILKPGSTFAGMIESHGDYDAWFVKALAPCGVRCEVHDIEKRPPPDSWTADGWIITGAPSSVAGVGVGAAAGGLFDWIRAAIESEAPLLGVCYGHQAICAAAGGEVARNPGGWELGTVEVDLTPAGRADRLFDGLPERFAVQTTHEDIVTEAPAGALVLARNEHSEIQAVAIGRACRGVQFHPEVTAPIARDFVSRRGHLVNPPAGVREAPLGARVLANFVAGFVGRE